MVEAVDDPTIMDSDRLLRRVRPNQIVPLPDGSFRPASSVFKDTELSVNVESLMLQQGRSPQDSLKGYQGFWLTAIPAGAVRARGPQFPIVKDLGSEHDPAHALVLGKKPDSFANAMVRAHTWLVVAS
jgi:hypothetical protein